jgi:hypothetical protein
MDEPVENKSEDKVKNSEFVKQLEVISDDLLTADEQLNEYSRLAMVRIASLFVKHSIYRILCIWILQPNTCAQLCRPKNVISFACLTSFEFHQSNYCGLEILD